MGKLNIIKTIASKLNSLGKTEEHFIILKDSKDLYVDVEGERIHITDFVEVANDTELLATLAPITNKYYYVTETNELWRYVNSNWKCLNAKDFDETLSDTSTNAPQTKLVKRELDKKLPLSGGAMSKGAEIRLDSATTTDGRYRALGYEQSLYIPSTTSSWAFNIGTYKQQNGTRIGGFGAWGDIEGLQYYYIGQYDNTLLRIDKDGNITYTGTLNATTANSATKAIQDSDGNNIVETYSKIAPTALALDADLNKIVYVTGHYYAKGGNNIVNKPPGVDSFGLELYQSALGYFTQELTAGNTNPSAKWIRQCSDTINRVWSDWTPVTVFSSIPTSDRVLVSTGSVGKIKSSDITTTELGYLSGTIDNIQEQLNNKALKHDTSSIPYDTGRKWLNEQPIMRTDFCIAIKSTSREWRDKYILLTEILPSDFVMTSGVIDVTVKGTFTNYAENMDINTIDYCHVNTNDSFQIEFDTQESYNTLLLYGYIEFVYDGTFSSNILTKTFE